MSTCFSLHACRKLVVYLASFFKPFSAPPSTFSRILSAPPLTRQHATFWPHTYSLKRGSLQALYSHQLWRWRAQYSVRGWAQNRDAHTYTSKTSPTESFTAQLSGYKVCSKDSYWIKMQNFSYPRRERLSKTHGAFAWRNSLTIVCSSYQVTWTM